MFLVLHNKVDKVIVLLLLIPTEHA